jgi:hypothetical protein
MKKNFWWINWRKVKDLGSRKINAKGKRSRHNIIYPFKNIKRKNPKSARQQIICRVMGQILPEN